MKQKHLAINKKVMSVWEAALLLNETVDESDPDLDMPQIEHLLQTAEAIRKDHPNEDWFHLVGFIHGVCGKYLLFLVPFYSFLISCMTLLIFFPTFRFRKSTSPSIFWI